MIKIADINMDNVNIEIQSSSSKATDGVNQLIETLNNLNSALSASQQNINKYTQSMNKISKASQSVKIPSVSNNINKVNKVNKINNDNLSKELELLNSNLPNGGKKIVDTKNIEQATSGVSSLKARLESLKGSTDKISQRIKNMFKSIIGSKAAQLAIKGIGSAFGNLGGRLANIKQSIGSTLKSLSKYVLALYGIRSAFYGVRNVTREFLSSQDAVAQQLSANISYLKYALGSTLAPVIEFITNLIYSLLKAIQYLVYFFAKVNIFSRASAKNLASGAGSAGKTTKELQKQLQAFDELNNINLENNSGSGGGGGAGSIAPDIDLSQIDPAFEYLFDDIENWGIRLAEKINEILSKINWDAILEKAERASLLMTKILNDFTATLDFSQVGYSIAQGLNTAIIFLNTFFQEYDWEMLGTQLAIGLNSMINTIRWAELGQLLTDRIRALILTIEGFVTTFDWINLGKNVGEMIKSAFFNIPWDSLSNAINVGLSGILDSLITFLDTVPWDEIGKTIGEFLNDINWTEILGKAFEAVGKIGKALIEVLWNTIFSGSDTVILAILGVAFATVKSGILKNLLPGLSTITSDAQSIVQEVFGTIFRVAVGLILIFDSLKTSWDKATNQAQNGLSLENIAKNLGGGLEAGIGTLMLTKNVKLALLVGIGKISFDTGIDIGTEINKSNWVQKEYDHYIEAFNIDTEKNPIVRALKGIAAILGTMGDAILTPIRSLGEKIGTALGEFSLKVAREIINLGQSIKIIGQYIIQGFNQIGQFFGKEIEDAGGNIAKGILNGILKIFENIGKWITENIFNPFINGIKNIFKMHSPSKVMEDLGINIIQGLLNGISSLVGNIIIIAQNIWNNFTTTLSGIANWVNTTIIQPTINFFNNLYVSALQIGKNIYNGFTGAISNISNFVSTRIVQPVISAFSNLWNSISGIFNNIKNVITNSLSNINVRIKLPHFSWTSQPASGWMANILSALNLPTSLPKLNVSWYAQGGYPTEGDLFFANESGPEMVGSIGSKTAVANNDQITRAIAQATYQAISQALNENQDNDQPIIINIGNETLYKGMTKSRSQASNQYGIAL